MNWIFHLFCAVYGIFCEENSFTIYWNVPTHQCEKLNVSFISLLKELNIVHNKDGNFSGESFTILYSPGLWPSMEHKNITNGGMPQCGNMTLHLEKLEKDVKEKLKDDGYSGLAVIDMESWRPVFRQNTGWMIKYRELTFEQYNKTLAEEYKNNTTNDKLRNRLIKESAEIFEAPAKDFLMNSTELVKKYWKDAKWGYYGFPYCFNMGVAANARNESCPKIVKEENNKTEWLFKSYDYWFPSVYITKVNFTCEERGQLVRGRVTEYQRLRKEFNPKAKIYPYVWFLYNLSNEYLSKEDLEMSLKILKMGKMDGAVIWGSSKNLTKECECKDLYDYVNGTMRTVLEGLKKPENNVKWNGSCQETSDAARYLKNCTDKQ
uniref:Salivary hyaluronidase n=1 Tax=Lutzomyia longipalpis TaxID=7200 RepID=HUGA_LUTLO|nr:putative hyaluronidase [Lutzomyia longipalpis]